MRHKLAPLIAAVLLAAPMAPAGATVLPNPAPLPFARPASPASAFDALLAGKHPDQPASAETEASARFKDGLAALDRGDIAEARAARDGLPAGSVERQTLSWSIVSSGSGAVTSEEILAAQRELRAWPGHAALRAHLERALYREKAQPDEVTRHMGSGEAATAEGMILRARAQLKAGNEEAARALLSPWWRTARLESYQESAILREFGEILDKTDHRLRMERMLYADRISSANRLAALAGAQELARAFAAVTRNAGNAGKLLDAVPEEQRTAAYTFAKARHLRRAGKYRDAAAVMLDAPTDATLLADPDSWWIERRVLSREMLDLGEPKIAYEIAAEHAAVTPVHAADAEFHAGWYAFRALGDAAAGARHFARIAEVADGPISLARAHYWLGRTAEAGAPGDARSHYEQAARHGTTFYGQLAAARLGKDKVEWSSSEATDWDRRRFAARPPVQAIRALEAAGHPSRAESLYRALAGDLDSIGEIGLLAGMAEARGDHYLALRIGKLAAQRGVDVGDLAHPTGVIPAEADISGSGEALAYAIARQESEFRISAKSGAGALGLLQLLPGTAKEMARKAGLGFTPARLTTDAAYNATLGTSYLQEQLGRFDGSYVLTFIGYNAGPGRALEWIKRYGDPRGKAVEDVVDWVERIPYPETRGYVQRVMENYQVYKMRLTGRMDIEGDLVNGRSPTIK